MTDFISRADAIEAMWKALYAYQDITEKQFQANEELDLADWFQHRIFVQRMHEECMKAVDSLPSADITETETCQKCQDVTDTILNRQGEEIKRLKASAEAVQGEWIDIDNYYRMATCSHCHKVAMFEKWGEYTKPYDFCPNCGARMEGGEDKCRQKTGK